MRHNTGRAKVPIPFFYGHSSRPLQRDGWESLIIPSGNRSAIPPPLVPRTFCFDETRRRLGISKPTWPHGKFADNHPWPWFITKARDERVSHKTVQAELKNAGICLDSILKTVGKEYLKQIQIEFQNSYHGELQRYRGHTWQAIDAWARPKNQCWRDRCYYNAKLVEIDGAWESTDTKLRSNRVYGTCAENCLHAEETEWRAAKADGKLER